MTNQAASESTPLDLESLRQSVLSLSNPSVTYEELKSTMDGVDVLIQEVRAHRAAARPNMAGRREMMQDILARCRASTGQQISLEALEYLWPQETR